MKKGFTLIELLAVIVILSIISGIGIVTFSSLTNKSESDYYENLESNLELIASSYFADNRSRRPSIDEVCSKATLSELKNGKYLSSVVDADGESCDLENSYIYIKRNENKQYEYKVSLNCGEYTNIVLEDEYCVNEESSDTTILVDAKDGNNNSYSLTRSYSNAIWVNTNVSVSFDSSVAVSKYVITNTSTSDVYTCEASANKCSYTFDKRGIYSVRSYNGEESVGERTFNIWIDKVAPTFTLTNAGNYNISTGSVLNYSNSLANITDESGINKISYTLIENGVDLIQKEGNDTNITINGLSSGKYTIKVKAFDKAGNESDWLTKEFYITRSIRLIDPTDESYSATYEVIDGTNYNYLGTSLPTLTKTGSTFLGWYTTSSGNTQITNTSMVETSTVALYARWE